MRKNKIFRKITAFTAAVFLFNQCLVTAVMAQDNEIIAGDAAATSDNTTVANTNVTEIPGSLDTGTSTCPDLTGQTSCPEDITISTDNQAASTAELNAEAGSGDNSSTGATGDALIVTGDTAALVNSDTTLNTNIVEFVATESAVVDATPETVTVAIENVNDGEAQNNAVVEAGSGDNKISESLGDAQILTGDAVALANIVNVMNTNIVGSNFKVYNLDILEEGTGDINLDEIWKNILSVDGDGNITMADGSMVSNMKLTVMNENMACLENNVLVEANTGKNTQENNGDATTVTGDAVAAANVVNIVNTNILGSRFLLGNINILSGWRGNLILPRPEYFAVNTEATSVANTQTETKYINEVDLNNNSAVSANSGENSQINNSGNQTIITGQATAINNTLSIVNMNIYGNNWFYLLINNPGGWTGQILNWDSPGSVEEASVGTLVHQLMYPGSESEGTTMETKVDNFNLAKISNNIVVSADSGNNSQTGNDGDAVIKTGSVTAVSNLFNLVNTNILGGRWFLGSVNVLGGWSGNAIYAYPDVAINISGDRAQAEPGDTVQYTLHYKNLGYEAAKGVQVKLGIPENTEASCQSQGCMWELGSLKPGQEGTFPIFVKIKDSFSFADARGKTLWDTLVPAVQAEDNRKSREIGVSAYIFTPDPDSNLSNNNSSAQAIIMEKTGDPNIKDQRQPKLEITAVNNVNDFVYPGDIVTFVIKVNNTSDVTAFNAYVEQSLYTQAGQFIGISKFDLGDLPAGKGGTLSFGLTIPKTAGEGKYSTKAVANATATNGNLSGSGEAWTSFYVRARASFVSDVSAAGEDTQVLGTTASDWTVNAPQKMNIWPYLLMLLGSASGLTGESIRIWRKLRAA